MSALTARLFLPSEIGLCQVSAHWYETRDGDPQAAALFQRHYSCIQVKTTGNRARFAGPGEHLVLIDGAGTALFVWRRERFRLDGQHGINCSVFRNESAERSSALIEEAMEVAWSRWPGERLFTFVDARKVMSTNPGYCFLCAGWRRCGVSQNHALVILETCR